MSQLLSPVGRLVQGNFFEGASTNMEGQLLTFKDGRPRQEFFMAVAFAKDDPETKEMISQINEEGKLGFPKLFPKGKDCINPNFSWKIQDGDSDVPNSKGNKNCDRPGFPGNFILTFKSSYAPKVYQKGGEIELNDPEAIKRGDYIRVIFHVKSNKSSQRPGLFLNQIAVEFYGKGEEIRTEPSYGSAFAKQAGYVPKGIKPATNMFQ
jgi:hypothetical protein